MDLGPKFSDQFLPGLVRRAVLVSDALVLAADGGVAKVVGQARAHALVAHAAVLGVGPAGVGLARVAGRPLGAPLEGITLVVGPALADGLVVVGVAVGILPAGARAGVHALLVVASQVLGAVAGGSTLGPALWRGADVLWQAGAGRGVVLDPAGGVGPAG